MDLDGWMDVYCDWVIIHDLWELSFSASVIFVKAVS